MTVPLPDLSVEYADNVGVFSNVPNVANDFVCNACLGPVKDFSRCYACSKLFSAAPSILAERIIPITSALNPGPWYTRLQQYKAGHHEYAWVLVALLEKYLAAHADDVTALLGGPPDLVTIVPSKRGTAYADQMLARVVNAVPSLPRRDDSAANVSARCVFGHARCDRKPSAADRGRVGQRRDTAERRRRAPRRGRECRDPANRSGCRQSKVLG